MVLGASVEDEEENVGGGGATLTGAAVEVARVEVAATEVLFTADETAVDETTALLDERVLHLPELLLFLGGVTWTNSG